MDGGAEEPIDATLVIVDGQVFDGESDEISEAPVLVGHDRVLAAGAPRARDAVVVDAGGGFVVPGLIDAHFHAYGIGLDLLALERAPMSYVAHRAAGRLAATLRRGFTTVRDVAGGDIGLRRALAEGLIAGPRYLYTGPALTQTGGHADPRPGESGEGPCRGHMGEVVDGPDAIRRVVRERFRTGAHAIKLMTSGGVVSPTDPLRVPQYSAEAILHSVDNGVRSIEHGNLLDEAAARAMSQAGAYLVPTLVTYDSMRRRGAGLGLPEVSRDKNAEVLAAGMQSVETARRAGVRVGFGTDLMGDLEDDQLFEFRIRCEMEGPLEVLRSATSVNADLIGRPDLGRIRPGAVADLVILPGDPRSRPEVLWGTERLVVRGGVVIDR